MTEQLPWLTDRTDIVWHEAQWLGKRDHQEGRVSEQIQVGRTLTAHSIPALHTGGGLKVESWCYRVLSLGMHFNTDVCDYLCAVLDHWGAPALEAIHALDEDVYWAPTQPHTGESWYDQASSGALALFQAAYAACVPRGILLRDWDLKRERMSTDCKHPHFMHNVPGFEPDPPDCPLCYRHTGFYDRLGTALVIGPLTVKPV